MEYYEDLKHIMRDDDSKKSATKIQSYNHPQGWQAVLRDDRKEQQILIVVHRLGEEEEPISIPLPNYKKWTVQGDYSTKGKSYNITNQNILEIQGLSKSDAAGIWLN